MRSNNSVTQHLYFANGLTSKVSLEETATISDQTDMDKELMGTGNTVLAPIPLNDSTDKLCLLLIILFCLCIFIVAILYRGKIVSSVEIIKGRLTPALW